MDRLAAMEAFVRVIETGSFSGAARQLNVGQPAISKTIAQLEDYLGVRLVLRSNKGLTPTEAGETFYDRARRVIEDADEAETMARGVGATLTGRLRVCVAVTFGRLHIIPHLHEFLAEHPAVDVDVIMDDRSIDLIEEGIDIAFRMGSLTDSTLTARKIGECRRLVMGTPAYFEKHGKPATPADLASHQAILLSQPRLSSAWNFKQGTSEMSVSVKGRVRVSAGEGVREAVLSGLGLTISSEWLFAPELKSGTIESSLDDWSLPNMDLWAVYPTGRRASVKARTFAQFVEDLMRGQSFSRDTDHPQPIEPAGLIPV